MTLFQSVLDVGCRNAIGKTTAADVIAGIWKDFHDNVATGVKRADGTPMTYWGLTAQNLGCFTTADLLKYHDGRCGAWADFFQDVLSGQGIRGSQSSVIKTKDLGKSGFVGYGFWVNPILGQGGTKTHIFPPPPLNNLNFDSVTASAQYSWFSDHVVVKYNGEIYDPSYGSLLSGGSMPVNELAWEKASVDVLLYTDRSHSGFSYRWIEDQSPLSLRMVFVDGRPR